MSTSIPEAKAVLRTHIPGFFPAPRRGHSFDMYDLKESILLAATDSARAFDRTMRTGIPGKGLLVILINLFWLRMIKGEILGQHHFLPQARMGDERFWGKMFLNRSMLCKKPELILPVTCRVSGFLFGNLWDSYDRGDYANFLPRGLKECDQFAEPVFIPFARKKTSRKEPVSFEEMCRLIGATMARRLRDRCIGIYDKAREICRERNLVLADAKFRFGLDEYGDAMLIDDLLTTESSQYIGSEAFAEYRDFGGRRPEAYGRQHLCAWLEREIACSRWSASYCRGPSLPKELVKKIMDEYHELYKRLLTLGS